MAYLWDYNEKDLEKTEEGRIFILERLINYGPSRKREKIKLDLVKKYWDQLDIYEPQKQLLELLIWGKYGYSHRNNRTFSIR